MSVPLPRNLAILRENFNADLRGAKLDGITNAELIALAGAVAEDLIMALPVGLRGVGVDLIVGDLGRCVKQRTEAGE